MSALAQQIEKEFQKHFDGQYLLVRAPGRVNLIGEHTDYNKGFVLPAAVDKSIVLAMSKNEVGKARFFAADKEEYFETDLTSEITSANKEWPNYLLGVLDQLRKSGYDFDGVDCVFGGNMPIGAGMSSSAALEGGVLFGMAQLYNWDIPAVKMAQIAQRAENNFVGVQCGIMDQFISLNGKAGHAMKLDCRSLDYEFFPFNRDDIRIVLCDTGIRRELASSEYNIRRSQCEQGVAILQEFDPEISSLRDVSLKFLFMHEDDLPADIFKRCKYVVEENKRVLQACRDLQQNDFYSFGQRMYQSHTGLRLEYEVSCKELDTLVDMARQQQGVLGARMMGGGFGGCTINLVEQDHLAAFTENIKKQYQSVEGREAVVYSTTVSAGTHLIEEENLSPVK